MSERYWNSRQSNISKKGNPDDHENAVAIVANVVTMHDARWKRDSFSLELTAFGTFSGHRRNILGDIAPWSLKHIKEDGSYTHEFDLYFTKRFVLTGLMDELIIEVDGQIHDTNEQKARDKFARSVIDFLKPDCYFARFNKDDVLEYASNNQYDKILQELVKQLRQKLKNTREV